MASIVIPAHNEASVIERSLQALVQQLRKDDEVYVVANGCTDCTAELAEAFPAVRVLRTPLPSKAAALNLGDAHAHSFPRVYLDADVVLEPGALDSLRHALTHGGWLAAAPEPRMDLTGASWAVRAFYRIWLALPYCRAGMIGAGVYALSEEGRARFERFPDLIADDGFVRAQFREHERTAVPGPAAIVRAPASLAWLLKIKARSRLGGWQLRQAFPELQQNEEKDYRGAIAQWLFRPGDWPALVVYLYVNLAARLLAWHRRRDFSKYRWERDLSTRSTQTTGEVE